MKRKLLVVITVLLMAVLAIAALYTRNHRAKDLTHVNNYQDCVDAGNPIILTAPEQCETKDGKHFVNN